MHLIINFQAIKFFYLTTEDVFFENPSEVGNFIKFAIIYYNYINNNIIIPITCN